MQFYEGFPTPSTLFLWIPASMKVLTGGAWQTLTVAEDKAKPTYFSAVAALILTCKEVTVIPQRDCAEHQWVAFLDSRMSCCLPLTSEVGNCYWHKVTSHREEAVGQRVEKSNEFQEGELQACPSRLLLPGLSAQSLYAWLCFRLYWINAGFAVFTLQIASVKSAELFAYYSLYLR